MKLKLNKDNVNGNTYFVEYDEFQKSRYEIPDGNHCRYVFGYECLEEHEHEWQNNEICNARSDEETGRGRYHKRQNPFLLILV